MCNFLGIDTSNYTTSVAVFNSNDNSILQAKKLLPVKNGEKGLRQSDAVFHHTVQLPQMINELYVNNIGDLTAVGVSKTPTGEKGSYMPCFLTGVSVATAVSKTNKIPMYEFSHQAGHIAAVLCTTGNENLINKEFLAFHLSGGTTQALLVKPDRNNIFDIELVASSLDLKAGQAIDRAGVMLGLQFPCGAELDKLSIKSEKEFNIKVSMKGNDVSLSGIENKFKKMLDNGETKEDIAKFCIMSVVKSVEKMYLNLTEKYGNMPVVFSGGVSSNSLMREYFTSKYGAVFTKPIYAADNAVGISYLTYLMYNKD